MAAIRVAHIPAEIPVIRELFREYAADIGVDLCFQGFEQELAELPGTYAPPGGAILLAVHEDRPVGCVALRPLPVKSGCGCGTAPTFGARLCEMKRLYVKPALRSLRLGRQLAEAIVAVGRRSGYQRMLLDTLESMTAARALYRSLGFVEIEPYYANPLPQVVYMELRY